MRTFEQRFSLLWNSWAKNIVFSGNLDANEARLNTISTSLFPYRPSTSSTTPGMLSTLFSVAVMFLAAVFSLVMHSQSQAPPIIGYASSLIRDSTCFQDSGVSGSSAEGGPEKSKRLGRLKVMVADVRGEKEEAERIAFAPVRIGKRIEKGRWYE
ncbi:hypothetical protein EK21DRAFT_111641 [Setomelanomma holmii]|uniref:Uncharacterized protein n=1 Tax=Setomelanomma holmii TaxID=210430 RepID=A0A9P4HAR5_9PLEO|nr:hypothetical protein EK21DRAFT_111641 [Setomelanomma holmii]